jgi:hypothetical protein
VRARPGGRNVPHVEARSGARRFAVVAVVAGLIAVGVAACGDDDGDEGAADATTEATTAPATAAEPTTEAPATTAPPTTTEAAPPQAAAGLPAYTAGYEDWLRLNAQPIPPSPNAPHGDGDKNVYVSATRAEITSGGDQQYPYPDGTVVLKTAGVGSDPAGIIAVMRKIEGSDPAHGDWDFIEWSRSSEGSAYTLLAEDQVCWSCHMVAEQTDWVYTTLP